VRGEQHSYWLAGKTGYMFLLVVLGEGYYTVQCERWQEELLWEIPDGRVSSE
jgi:hypothetical protein